MHTEQKYAIVIGIKADKLDLLSNTSLLQEVIWQVNNLDEV